MDLFATDMAKLDFLLEADAELALAGLDVEAAQRALAEEGEGAEGKKRPKYVATYVGSKQKLVDWIWRSTPEGVKSVLDAFSGSAVVAYMYKTKSLRVTANDRLRYAWHTPRGTIENRSVNLTGDENRALVAEPVRAAAAKIDSPLRPRYDGGGRKATPGKIAVPMMRRTILALAILLAALPAGMGAEVEVAGRWRGVVTMKGFAYHHLVKVKKTGRGFAAKALVWCGLTESQALGAARGRKPSVPEKAFAFALLQAYDVAFSEDVLAFSGGKVKHLFRVLGNYETFTFSGKVEPPGILAAAARDASGETGTVQLWKDGALDQPRSLRLKRGVVRKLACLHTERYHYTCYLPKNYDPATPTPVLVNFSPGGNGRPLSTKMADELGWIMVGLTESKNGPIQPSAENRDAVLLDIRRRFNVHPRRLYFSGCSGGARMAAWSAESYPQWCAGAICIAAGFLQSRPPLHQAVFFIAGKSDFNKEEVTELHAAEKRKGRRTRLIIHPGGHGWGRAQDHEAAIRWLEELAGKKEKR